ncbi:MAG: alkaline phosphatase family protein [Opitutus sp.]|nr:alkaline phosphatase family protein [Opitutus sp.]
MNHFPKDRAALVVPPLGGIRADQSFRLKAELPTRQVIFARWRALRIGLMAVCLAVPGSSAAPVERPAAAPLLLISLDAFRWDYIANHPDETPHLRQLMREGVSTRALIPVFPTQTFATHYSIATGLYPSHHGIIGNGFFDAQRGEFFNYRLPISVRDGRWFGGEPIWVTAIKQGRKSACYFWVGAEAEIGGVRPTFWKNYDYGIPFATRLDVLMGWLHLPPDQRPAVTLFYFEETNVAGHYYGPGSAEVTAAIKLLDGNVGAIVDRAKAEGIELNLIVVSDHGMADTEGQAQTTILDDHLDLTTVQVDFDGPIAGLRPRDNDVDALLRKLAALSPHYHIYRSEDLPARLHVSPGPRIPSVWILPDEGWRIQQRSRFISTRDSRLKGDHGYDNAFTSMRGIFIAHGPAFKNDGSVFEPVENIHIYNLLSAAIGVKPAPNDGDDRLLKAVLR